MDRKLSIVSENTITSPNARCAKKLPSGCVISHVTPLAIP